MDWLFFELTLQSVAVHVMAVCMKKYEARVFMQTDSACAVDLHWLVIRFPSTRVEELCKRATADHPVHYSICASHFLF